MSPEDKELAKVRAEWELLGRADPLWAVVSAPGQRGNRWNVQEFFATGVERIGKIAARLEEQGFIFRGESALDFGCGVGRLTQALADRYAAVVGVDISSAMVHWADIHNAKGGRVAYVVNTRPDLSQFSSGSFALVFSDIALQHVPPRLAVRYIREFFRIVRSDGRVVFQLPSRPSSRLIGWIPQPVLDPLFNGVRRLLRWARPQDYPPWETHWMSKRRVRAAITAGGGKLLATIQEEGITGSLESQLYLACRVSERPPPAGE